MSRLIALLMLVALLGFVPATAQAGHWQYQDGYWWYYDSGQWYTWDGYNYRPYSHGYYRPYGYYYPYGYYHRPYDY